MLLKPEELASVDLTSTESYRWWLEMAQQRGQMLRFFLMRGVLWSDLERWVETLRQNKESCRRIFVVSSAPVKIKLQEKTNGTVAGDVRRDQGEDGFGGR